MSSAFLIMKNTLILFIMTIVSVSAQFSIPAIEIQAISPLGMRVALLDVPGMKLFGFHGKVNKPLVDKKVGDIFGDITSPKNGRWIFEDSNVQLKVGDVIYYWIFVQHDAFGYRKEDQVYNVSKLVPPNTPWSLRPQKQPSPNTNTNPVKVTACANPSITTINDGKAVCSGEVLFEEKFNESLNKSKWIIENRLPDDDQENEFVSYQPRSVTSVSGKLKITPYLLHRISPSITQDTVISGTLDLTKGCTSSNDLLCKQEALGYDILPPVVSGKITTRNLFSFKYGRIDIKARLPQGDWIYPELYLESSRQRYGTGPYESGQMRVAFSRGNRDLKTDTEVFDNSVLSGGIMLGLTQDCRTAGMRTISREDFRWGDDFHTYTLIWTPESIELLVDNESYGNVVPGFKDIYKNNNTCPSLATSSQRWAAGTKMAPFDQEFYIAIGLGVGGIADFPDGIGDKTWRNKSKKAKFDFFNFISTWSDMLDDNKSLLVDSVKVTAI